MRITSDIVPAVEALQNGGIIAYPTEAVYGLGCDPLNQVAVQRLLLLKKRPVGKGLILIAATWEQLIPYVETISREVHGKGFSNLAWTGNLVISCNS